jgi:hypothetical protein
MGYQTIGLSDEDKSIGSPALRPDGSGLSIIKLYIGLSDLNISIGSPVLRPDGSGLIAYRKSNYITEYRIWIKVSGSLF